MKIQTISGAEIGKILHSKPFIENNIENSTEYEWFYFEIKHENSCIVLIFSLKDPFCIHEKTNKPTSLYLTWHIGQNLVAYSYSVLSNSINHALIQEFQNFLSKKSDILDLWIPDFSYKKYIHLKLSNPFCEIQQDDLIEKSPKMQRKHFWQFLLSDHHAHGLIETIHVENKIFYNFCKKPNSFHDVILKNRLQKTSVMRCEFNNSHIYADHNFGYEALYQIQDSWYWWHLESKDKWEVCYYFPKQKTAFYHSNESTHEIISLSLSKTPSNFKMSSFFVIFPKKIISFLFKEIVFSQKIESAPFYLRIKSADQISKHTPSATLEVLLPNRISNWVNQVLMSARQIKIKNCLLNTIDLEETVSFKDICTNITKNNGKSFYFASHALSKHDRQKAYLIYSLCRLIDDATDSQSKLLNLSNHPNSKLNSTQGSEFSKNLLNCLWNTQPNIALELELVEKLKERISYCLFKRINIDSTKEFFLQAKNEIQTLKLEKTLFEDLLLGQAMDESFKQPKNFQEFYRYCYCVAGVVGLMMTKIFKVKTHPNALPSAEHLGIAMQITNILRDIKEDFEMGRVYLPNDICLTYDIRIENKLFSDTTYKVGAKTALVTVYAEHALDYYNQAIIGIKFIKRFRDRLCVKLMTAIYAGILAKILNDPLVVFTKRITVTKFEKFLIFSKVILGFHPLKASGIKHLNYKSNKEISHEKI